MNSLSRTDRRTFLKAAAVLAASAALPACGAKAKTPFTGTGVLHNKLTDEQIAKYCAQVYYAKDEKGAIRRNQAGEPLVGGLRTPLIKLGADKEAKHYYTTYAQPVPVSELTSAETVALAVDEKQAHEFRTLIDKALVEAEQQRQKAERDRTGQTDFTVQTDPADVEAVNLAQKRLAVHTILTGDRKLALRQLRQSVSAYLKNLTP